MDEPAKMIDSSKKIAKIMDEPGKMIDSSTKTPQIVDELANNIMIVTGEALGRLRPTN